MTGILLIGLLAMTLLITGCQQPEEKSVKEEESLAFVTPLGKKYEMTEPSEKMMSLYQEAKLDHDNDPDNIDNIIWLGRRIAYLGKYEEAIQVFSDGIKKYPDESRLYRHRGHRYISIRKFDKAIEDLTKASELIEGTENSIEPDGMPNALGIPVSSRHGNIWYHLGLAYYLKHDYENAYTAYVNCRESGSNADNIVSSTHWLYMIQRRLENKELADQMLEPVIPGMKVIENHGYYKLCRFYKGELSLDSLITSGENSSASDAVKYGLANWYHYNGEREKSKAMLEEILSGDVWASFGYIAAESDVLEYYK